MKKKLHKKMTYEEKVKNKCVALLKLVIGIQEFYKTANNDNKRFIETTIGAAIWYLPKNKKVLFTGKISKEAIEKDEKSEDHFLPRKIAAKEILEFNWEGEVNTVETLSRLYKTKYGKFNYVSKLENKRLKNFQGVEVFKSSEIAYKNAGIVLVNYKD